MGFAPAFAKSLRLEPEKGQRMRMMLNAGLFLLLVSAYLTIAVVSPYGPPGISTLLVYAVLVGFNALTDKLGWGWQHPDEVNDIRGAHRNESTGFV